MVVRVMCACEEREERQRAEEEAQRIRCMRERCFESAPALAGCTFEADDQKNTKVSAACERYANTFERGDPYGLLLFGEVGGGKTYMAAAVANRLIERGFSVLHTDIGSVATLMESSFEKRQRNLERILSYDLLIIDDLGTEYETQFYNSTVYNIINSRINSSRPTIINTNLDYAGINKRYEARVVSRLTTIYSCLEFKGEDIRMQKRLAQI